MVMSIIAAIMYTFSNACVHGVLASSTARMSIIRTPKQIDAKQIRPNSYHLCLFPIPIPY